MKKVLLFLTVLFVIGLSSVYAQTVKYPIEIEKGFLGHTYSQNGIPINSVWQMKNMVGRDELALNQLKWASADAIIGYVFSYAGGFAIGWELGYLIAGKKMDTPVLLAGAGSIGVGLLFSYLADRRMVKGASIYNDNLGTTSYGYPVELDFGLVPSGVGLTLSF